MARAKRTDRSEARRAYRERLKEEMEIAAATEASEAEEPTVGVGKMRSAHDRGARDGEFANPVGGKGMMSSAKAAFRQPHYIEDLKFFPTLALRTHAVWPSALFAVAATALCLPRVTSGSVIDANDPVISVASQFILAPIPTMLPMVAGYFAPRATWLAGAVAGALGVFGLSALFFLSGVKPEITTPGHPDNLAQLTITWLTLAVPAGAVIGAASGWYKRFLGGMQAANPRPTRNSGKKPAARTGRPAGR